MKVVCLMLMAGLLAGMASGFEKKRYEDPPGIETIEVDPQKMVFVKGGAFQMGDKEFGSSQYYVELDSFYMVPCEITQEEMARVMNWALQEDKICFKKESIVEIKSSGSKGKEKKSTWTGRVIQPKGSGFQPNLLKRNALGWDNKEECFSPDPRFAQLPCKGVSWYGAAAYCNYRSEMEGLRPCYRMRDRKHWRCNFSANGYRLPTEAEWEYAARGGRSGKNYQYSGGNLLDDVGWYADNSKKFGGLETNKVLSAGISGESLTLPNGMTVNTGGSPGEWVASIDEIIIIYRTYAGTKKANELGLYDMSGNVTEWCHDWYDEEYSEKSRPNPTGPRKSPSETCVQRGGSTESEAFWCQVNVRSSACPEELRGGFRVVRSAASPEGETQQQ